MASKGAKGLRHMIEQVKESVLDIMARRLSQQDKNFLAKEWNLVPQIQTTSTTLPYHVKNVISLSSSWFKISQFINPHRREVRKVVAPSIPPAAKKQEEKRHPFFGRLLVDLGYKRVYCSSVDSLVRVPIWNKQRILRKERVQQIFERNEEKRQLPGVITLYEMKNQKNQKNYAPGSIGVIDGQHRIGALSLLAQKGKWDPMACNVLIDVFFTKTSDDIRELFCDINKSEPVHLVDMPSEDGGCDINQKKIINEAIQQIEQEFPEMFSSSSRCRIPHLNADSFRDTIFQSDVVTTKGFNSGEDLKKWLQQQNLTLSKHRPTYWKKLLSSGDGEELTVSRKKALEKAKSHNFYLGLHNSWLH